jgi:hypothetical protein
MSWHVRKLPRALSAANHQRRKLWQECKSLRR